MAVIALSAPSTARAEDPQRIAQPNDTAARACTQGPCGDYVLSGRGAAEPLSIQPIGGRTFETNEIAFFNLDPPAWAYDSVQGYEAVIDFRGTNVGTGMNWRPIACRTAGGDCEGQVHTTTDGAGGTVRVANLLRAGQVLKVGLQFRGSTGSPTVSSIVMRATVRWRMVDTQAPVLTPTAGGQPFGALPWLTRDTTSDVDVLADDNTEVVGQSVSFDGRRVDGSIVTLPDGSRRVTAQACDIAKNCASAGFDAKVDTNPPVAALTAATFATAQPEIPVQATDPPKDGSASGLGTADLVLTNVDESVFDVEARPVAGGFALVPRAPVPEGLYGATLRVRDRAANAFELPVPEFIVDLGAPTARPVTPRPRARLARRPEAITAAVADGVRVDDATLQLDGLTRETGFVAGDPEVTFVPERMCPGSHSVRVVATDPVGRTATAAWRFSVRGRMTKACIRERRCTAARARVERARKRVAAAKGVKRVRSARRSLSRQIAKRRRACR